MDAERRRPRLISLLFCDFYSITNDKKPNLLGIFDRIYVPIGETRTPRFTLFLRTAETYPGALTTTIIAPNKKAIAQFISIPDETAVIEGLPFNVQAIIILQLQVELEGVHWFDVSYEGNSLGGAGLVVKFRENEEQKDGGTDTYP